MSDKIELLAPGGDVDSIKAAIIAGADAVYCGLNKFNARNRAENISFENFKGILRIAHQNNCKIYLTLNILITDNELLDLIKLLNKLVNTKVDGVIIQDLGLFYLLNKYFPTLVVHASTQCTTHNVGQIHFLNKLGAKQINYSRELNLDEIKELNQVCKEYQIKSEVFVHGSYCVSFSGQCYMSSVLNGNSGNKGRCSQHCRDQYITTPTGKEYPLNLKDNSAFTNLKELADCGVSTIKIEGRIKKFEYVYSVVKTWKQHINHVLSDSAQIADKRDLYKAFNRDFTNAFLDGKICKDIFIDNPLSNSIKYVEDLHNGKSKEFVENEIDIFLKEKEHLSKEVSYKINKFDIEKENIELVFSGDVGEPISILINTTDSQFEIKSESILEFDDEKLSIKTQIDKLLTLIEHTCFIVDKIDVDKLSDNLYLSFKEINRLKKQIFYLLNGNKEYQKPVILPKLKRNFRIDENPSLSVLISSEKDLHLADEADVQTYFQLPNKLGHKFDKYFELFIENENIIPWFPSILIGDDFKTAVELLIQLKPQKIVTDNTGIALEAFKYKIPWIAGPFMNLINSYSLLCLKENFNCSGAFISNEINEIQLKSIRKPESFELHYSIYHPIKLMTNRLCLFHQVTGCEKKMFDDTCIMNCVKSASITNLNGKKFIIDKSEGNLNCLYNANNYLNTDVVRDLPNTLSSFMLDLRDVETHTKTSVEKPALIKVFKEFINGDIDSESIIQDNVLNTTNEQYKRGI